MKRTKRQQFGQHYLRDQKVIQSIVNLSFEKLKEHSCETLLEIGPGDGALTLPICARINDSCVSRYCVAEADHALIDRWNTYFTVDSKIKKDVKMLEGDFVQAEPSSFSSESARTGVVSNLPYSAGTAIILKLIEFPERIPFMILMVQAEVGERLRAEPDSKAWGSLSLWVQNTWKVERLIRVPPQSFSPPPKVNSEVLLFHPLERPRISETQSPAARNVFGQLVKEAFAHRRKMLRSTLGRVSRWQKALVAANVDDTKRAEALTWEEWQRLFSAAHRNTSS